jgi:hypothetical protein
MECLGFARIAGRRGARGAYLRIAPEDKAALGDPGGLDVVWLDGEFLEIELAPGATGYLKFIAPAMFGPPEKCYYTEETQLPGLAAAGRIALIPWRVGAQYARLAHPGLAWVVVSALDRLLGLDRRLVTGASPLVEVTAHREREGNWHWIGLLNHSGQLGTAFHAPVPMRDIPIELRADGSKARALRLGADLPLARAAKGRVSFILPRLDVYEIVVIE